MSSEPTRIGQIVGAHGLKGQVKVQPLTDFWEERFAKGTRLRLKDDWVTVEGFSIHKNRPLLTLSGVKSIDAAEKLQWEYLEAILEDLELDEDEFLTDDLIGCLVVTTDGRELGTVDEVLAMPAHDVLEVGEILIPVVKEFIKEIDLDAERIVVELIPGMLPGEEAEIA